MKKLIIFIILPIFFGFKTGDEIDEKRMNRDLEIAKNILATLIKSGSETFFGGESIDASYIKDYGVVFTIPEHLVYFHSGRSVIAIPEMPAIPDVDVMVDFEFSEDDEERTKEEYKIQKEITKQQQKEVQKQQKEFQKQMQELEVAREEAELALQEAKELQEIYVSSGQTTQIDWENIMVTFITDYSDLIGQLQPDERIVVKQKSPYSEAIFVWSGKDSEEMKKQIGGNISAEVLRKDVAAYKSGKIKKDEFVSRIEIKKKEPQKKIADLEMFANIFDRFYSADLTETYYSQGKPRYEVLDGFGVVFHIKASSGRSPYRRVEYYGTGNSWTIHPDDRGSNDAELYPKFKEDLKAFMLDYGRTIRSLKDDDKVMLEIRISSCRGCDIPESLEISANMSLLKQYDQQKISREKAMDQIEVKEKL